MPDAMNYSDLRKHLAATMDRVCDDHEQLIITRRGARPVVMLSLADYNSMLETVHLLSSPANAQQLLLSIEQERRGELQEHQLTDLPDLPDVPDVPDVDDMEHRDAPDAT